MTTIDGIESFAFSGDGAYLAMRRYPPAPPAAPGGGAAGATPPAAWRTWRTRRQRRRHAARRHDAHRAAPRERARHDVRQRLGVRLAGRRSLAPARDDDQRRGQASATACSSSIRTRRSCACSIQSAHAPYARVLTSGGRNVARTLAVLRAKTDDKHDGPTYAILAWTGVGGREQMHTFDPDERHVLPRRHAHRAVPRAVVVGGRRHDVRRHREVGRQAARARARRRRRRPRRGFHAGRRLGIGRRRTRVGGYLALDGRRRHGEAEAERRAGSPPQSARRLAPRHRQVRADRQVAHRAGDADPPHERGARRRVVSLCDGPIDRPSRRRHVSRGSRDGRAHEDQGQHQRPRRAGQSRRQVPALPAETISTGSSTSRRTARRPTHKERPDVVHRQGVRRDDQAEAAVRRRRLDEGRRGGAALRQVRHLAGRRPTGGKSARLTNGARRRGAASATCG